MHVGHHVKCPLLLPDFNQYLNISTILMKLRNVKFDENPFSGSRVVSCVQRDGRKNDLD
jgi:hypothetical protein